MELKELPPLPREERVRLACIVMDLCFALDVWDREPTDLHRMNMLEKLEVWRVAFGVPDMTKVRSYFLGTDT